MSKVSGRRSSITPPAPWKQPTKAQKADVPLNRKLSNPDEPPVQDPEALADPEIDLKGTSDER